MGRYDGEDYSEEHYLRRDLERASQQASSNRALLRQFVPAEDRAIWVMATLGVGNHGAFRHSDAVSALKEEAGMTAAQAKKAIDRWLEAEHLWDWTDQSDPVHIHGVELRNPGNKNVEDLVRQYGEPARDIYAKALQRERWYHISSSGRTLARALWPEGRSWNPSTLHYSYGSG